MTAKYLHERQSRLLGALTITATQRVRAETFFPSTATSNVAWARASMRTNHSSTLKLKLGSRCFSCVCECLKIDDISAIRAQIRHFYGASSSSKSNPSSAAASRMARAFAAPQPAFRVSEIIN